MANKTIDKALLVRKIQGLDGLSKEEKSELTELLNRREYGLVWEDKPENRKEELKVEIPFLIEDTVKRIIGTKEGSPNHIIIEGDNYQALISLYFIYERQIDLIYIDPPYNRGKDDFRYNDRYINPENAYKNSMWLSFMSKRLSIAKKLMKDSGLIFISIDDHELAPLILLCDDIFGVNNRIGTLPTIMNLKGNQSEFGFAGTHEYTLVYAKNKSLCKVGQFNIEEEDSSWLEDSIGLYKKGATLKRTGNDAPREHRPYGYYPILVNKEYKVSTVSEEEFSHIYNPVTDSFDDAYVDSLVKNYQAEGFTVLLPLIGSTKASWRWQRSKVEKEYAEIIVVDGRDGLSLYKKQRPELGDLPSKKPKSILYKPEYSSGNGSNQLESILGSSEDFQNPKPLELIKDFVLIGTEKDSLILDFFAGSGTTLHATMLQNKEDQGHRKCILVNSNEGNICEKVTYIRNKKVVQGYIAQDGTPVAGLDDNNLRYYKVERMSRIPSLKNKRKLVSVAIDLLCVKEDLYDEKVSFGTISLDKRRARYFEQGRKRMLVICDETLLYDFIDEIRKMKLDSKIKVYVFSYSAYAYEDDFAEVIDKVEPCALPAAILAAYKDVLPERAELDVNGNFVGVDFHPEDEPVEEVDNSSAVVNTTDESAVSFKPTLF